MFSNWSVKPLEVFLLCASKRAAQKLRHLTQRSVTRAGSVSLHHLFLQLLLWWSSHLQLKNVPAVSGGCADNMWLLKRNVGLKPGLIYGVRRSSPLSKCYCQGAIIIRQRTPSGHSTPAFLLGIICLSSFIHPLKDPSSEELLVIKNTSNNCKRAGRLCRATSMFASVYHFKWNAQKRFLQEICFGWLKRAAPGILPGKTPRILLLPLIFYAHPVMPSVNNFLEDTDPSHFLTGPN